MPQPMQRTVGRLRARRAAPEPSLLADKLPQYKTFQEWILDEALTSPAITEAVGSGWAVRVRDGFLSGELRATKDALLAAAPAALAHALRELR
jgi:hypothetical protein